MSGASIAAARRLGLSRSHSTRPRSSRLRAARPALASTAATTEVREPQTPTWPGRSSPLGLPFQASSAPLRLGLAPAGPSGGRFSCALRGIRRVDRNQRGAHPFVGECDGGLIDRAFWSETEGTMRTLLAAATAVAALYASPTLAANGNKQLGKVHFETSCTPAAQKAFDQGMLYQHSFWYRSSKQSFEDALKADPNCAIAYWGIGLSLLK